MRDLTIETKWQQRWREAGVFRAGAGEPPRFYCLEMLPYPSGRLHMGHVRNYSIGDAVARFRRMRGDVVMYAIGWDAFGMPAENAAIQRKESPSSWTRGNIEAMRSQLQRIGYSYDWDREIATCDPEFYRWNQWFFLRMYERGLAYRSRRPLNWCGACATVLANEQVRDGRCWRCENPVVLREFDQWFLRITDYAQELLDALDDLPDWPERVRTMQRNWIGRSEGAYLHFGIEGFDETIRVFTTRPDTVYGATYMALAAEHPMVADLVRGTDREEPVTAFVEEQLAKTLEERFAEGADKLGLDTGRCAVNPFSGERIPIWVANFVLMDVGTGAIMSVPAHDQRDFDFARAYRLPVRPVVQPADAEPLDGATMETAVPGSGVLRDSGPYDGLDDAAARAKMCADAEAGGFGGAAVTYRLKDWGISRQRYWGTPIPIVYCDGCGEVPVPDAELPVVLPDDVTLTGEGGSPLARIESFFAVDCPACGKPARRETDTMDTFVDSSWYYFRYLDPRNDAAPFAPERQAPWTPVDLYIGGIEHATLHLIYTRFWTKMMRDLGLVGIDEPVQRLFTQGMVIKDGAKMSKSIGNVVDPDDLVRRYGADTTRLFCLFASPPERDLDWNESGVEGCERFLNRVWRTFERVRGALPPADTPAPEAAGSDDAMALRRKTHRTIRRVTDDIDKRMHFNTAVSAIMELTNACAECAGPDDEDAALDDGRVWALREAFAAMARLLGPFAPHFAEELWESLGGEGFVSTAAWPVADEALLVEDEVTIVVQVGGKMRGRLSLPRGSAEGDVLAAAKALDRVAAHLEGKTVRRVIYVQDKLLNVVAT